MCIPLKEYINIHYDSCSDFTNVDTYVTNTLSRCHNHFCFQIQALCKHLCSYCMKWLRHNIETIELKNFTCSLDWIKRSEASIIKINSLTWYSFFHQCLFHVLWLIVACICIVPTHKYAVNFSGFIQVWCCNNPTIKISISLTIARFGRCPQNECNTSLNSFWFSPVGEKKRNKKENNPSSQWGYQENDFYISDSVLLHGGFWRSYYKEKVWIIECI